MSAPRRSKWTLTHVTLAHLFTLINSMREDEREQWAALVNPEPFDVEQAVAYCFQLPGIKFTLLGPEGEPLVAGGYMPDQRGNLISWMVGTEATWQAHWRSITEGTRFVMDCLLEDGHKRLETYALASRTLTAKWYTKGLGMQLDGILPRYAFNGADVALFSRCVPEDSRPRNRAFQFDVSETA